jgi:hypothetical protein
MHFSDLQVVRPIPEGWGAAAVIAARVARLALIYSAIALFGVAVTFVLCLVGLERTLAGIVGAILGAFVVLGVIHHLTMSVRVLRFTVRELEHSRLALLREIAALARVRLRLADASAAYRHDVPVVGSEPHEVTPRPTADGRPVVLDMHTESAELRESSRWGSRVLTRAIFFIVFALQITHMIAFFTHLLPSVSTFTAGLGAGVTITVVFVLLFGLATLLTKQIVKKGD